MAADGVGRAALVVLAAGLVASQVVLVRLADRFTHAQTDVLAVLPLVLLLAVPGALLIAAVARLKGAGPGLLAGMVATGLLMRAVHLGQPAILEDDFQRFLWDGAVLARGFDPWRYAPKALADGEGPAELVRLAAAHPDVIARINFPDLRSMYPGAIELVFAAAHLAAPFSLDGLRLAMAIPDAAMLALLLVVLRRLGLPPVLAALWWLNPLVVLVVANQAHFDVWLGPLVLGALVAARGGRGGLAGGLLGLAVGVKIWPVLLVPLAARALWPDRAAAVRGGLAFALVTAAVLAPLLLAARADGSGLVAYAGGWANNNGFYAWASWGLWQLAPGLPTERILRTSLAIAVGAVALWVARRPLADAHDLVARALVVTAVLFYLSPAQFPWYLLWMLPFAILRPSWPLVAATATMPAYYLFFPLAAADNGGVFVYGLAFVHAAPVLAWLAWSARR